MNLRQLGEDRLLEQILPRLARTPRVLAGAGDDDCAVLEFAGAGQLLLLKTDCVVEGVHFTSEAGPRAVGWKAMARPLSDFAAMGGVPQFALITLLVPPSKASRWISELYRGLEKSARAFGVAIVGGETSCIEGPTAISVAMSGAVERDRRISRHGGKPGDELFVTGRLGGSIRGKHLRFTPRIAEARWLTEHFRVHGMMDLSDGLGADLPRLARASQLGFEVDESAIPKTRGCSAKEAISDGEDYELLFAIAASESQALRHRWKTKFKSLPLTRIGRFIPKSGTRNQRLPRGYVHFQ